MTGRQRVSTRIVVGTVFFSVGAGVGHVSVRREAVEGVTLVVQQRAWPVDRRPSVTVSGLIRRTDQAGPVVGLTHHK
jgi:hypothetical protein